MAGTSHEGTTAHTHWEHTCASRQHYQPAPCPACSCPASSLPLCSCPACSLPSWLLAQPAPVQVSVPRMPGSVHARLPMRSRGHGDSPFCQIQLPVTKTAGAEQAIRTALGALHVTGTCGAQLGGLRKATRVSDAEGRDIPGDQAWRVPQSSLCHWASQGTVSMHKPLTGKRALSRPGPSTLVHYAHTRTAVAQGGRTGTAQGAEEGAGLDMRGVDDQDRVSASGWFKPQPAVTAPD